MVCYVEELINNYCSIVLYSFLSINSIKQAEKVSDSVNLYIIYIIYVVHDYSIYNHTITISLDNIMSCQCLHVPIVRARKEDNNVMVVTRQHPAVFISSPRDR